MQEGHTQWPKWNDQGESGRAKQSQLKSEYDLIVMVDREKPLESLSRGMAFSNIYFEEITLASMETVGKLERETTLVRKDGGYGFRRYP